MSTQPVGATSATAAPPAVSAGADFDSFADSVLDVQPEVAEGASADATDAGGAAAGTETDGGQPAAAAAEKQGDEQVAAESTEVDEWAIDQAALDKVFADPAHGAIVKALHEKFQRAVEGTRVWGKEAQEARALVPGGLPELKETVEIARNARLEDAAFRSGDPAKQTEVLSGMAKEMPEAFAAGAGPYLNTLATVAPQRYQEVGRKLAMDALVADGVTTTLAELFTAASKATDTDDAGFGAAFAKLKEWADKAGFVATPAAVGAKTAKTVDPELAATQAKLREYEDKDRQAQVETFKSWWTPTEEEISKGVQADVRSRLEEFLPKNIEKGFREFTMNDLVAKVERRLTEQMRADIGFQEKLAQVLGDAKAAKWKSDGAGVRTQYVNLSLGRAKQLLPHIVAEVMKPATQAAVAGAAAKTATQKTAAARTDVTGQGGAAKPGKWSVKDVKGNGALKGKTEEEILDM